MPFRYLHWLDCKDFLSNLLLKLIIFCFTDQPPITQSPRSVLNFKFSIFTFQGWWDTEWVLSKNCAKRKKKLRLQTMSNAIICIDKRFAVKNSGISCLVLIFNLSIPKLIILCSKLRDMTSSIPFFSVDRYKLMAQWLRRVAVSRGAWVQILQGTETFCLPSAILRGTELVSALARALLYCCALYNFYFLDFLSGDLALTGFYFLTWTSDFNCFGALGVGPGARTWLLAWRMGRDFSFCRASEQKCLKRLGHCFPLNFRKHWKSNGPSWGFFQPSSLRLIARVEKGALKTVETNTTLCPQLSSPKLLVWTAGPI